MIRRLKIAAATFAILCAGILPAREAAGQISVDLELVLAVDVSMSVDLEEQALQRDGYIAAFRDPDFIAAIRSGSLGRIAVIYVEWAGSGSQKIVVPWRLVDDDASASAFADALEQAPLERERRTSISAAILFSIGLFEGNGFSGTLQKIDVSGDGPNNAGPPVTAARDLAIESGITINGLPLLLKPGGFIGIEELDLYYEDCVIGGPGAFMLTVRERHEIVAAIRSKLILEVAERPASIQRVQFQPQQPRFNCMIGERLWQQFMDGP